MNYKKNSVSAESVGNSVSAKSAADSISANLQYSVIAGQQDDDSKSIVPDGSSDSDEDSDEECTKKEKEDLVEFKEMAEKMIASQHKTIQELKENEERTETQMGSLELKAEELRLRLEQLQSGVQSNFQIPKSIKKEQLTTVLNTTLAVLQNATMKFSQTQDEAASEKLVLALELERVRGELAECKEIADEATCRGCFSRMKRVIFKKCNHVYFCEECWKKYKRTVRAPGCPVCGYKENGTPVSTGEKILFYA